MSFGRQVHQVPEYLTFARGWGTRAISPGMDRLLFHICVRTLYAKDIFREISKKYQKQGIHGNEKDTHRKTIAIRLVN